MSLTLSSCFYIIKSKFPSNQYIEWMNNFISIVDKFNLVIYTDEHSTKYIDAKNNNKIKIVIRPLEHFYNYKYKEFWINNHEKNYLLNDRSCWELNMLWSEKISFVKETIERNYFNTEFYGWCDIGYFRNRPCDIIVSDKWASNTDFFNNHKEKICYACVKNDDGYLSFLYNLINDKTEYGLPKNPIPPHQVSIAGGFFILHKSNIDWWFKTYDNMLSNYFKNGYLVKDDQIILVNCILTNLNRFTLFRENMPNYDNWFMFQRILN